MERANIVLFGMMGSGKTTVGRLVAQRLSRGFIDTDAEVERAAGRPITALFAEAGEASFRALERAAVARAAREPTVVVAVGGGAVLDERNVAALKESGVLVYLDAPADVLAARVAGATDRPLLDDGDPDTRLGALLAERTPRYRRVADVTVDASAPAADVAEAVIAVVAERLATDGTAPR